MKKAILLCLISGMFCLRVSAQQAVTIYNPGADARSEVSAAIAKAATEGKHVFLQIGGNWCPWCIRFHKMIAGDVKLDSLLRANYEVVLVNYSKENDNHELLATLGYPQRFGFPVFVILDAKGKVIHIQDSWYLEQDKAYSNEKVEHFLRMWSAFTLKEAETKFGR